MLVNISLYGQKSPSYPSIKPSKVFFSFDKGQSVIKERTIRTVRNEPAYRLSIVSVSIESGIAVAIHITLNGIGEPSTRFDTKYEEDLLNPDRWGHGAEQGFTPKDFNSGNKSRGRRSRHLVFKLRRMRIEVIAFDVVLNESSTGITQAKVVVSVKADSSTRSRPARRPKPT
jgi:hypothetical protein